MIIAKGEKVHVIKRRRLESEPRRHFMGQVLEAAGAIVRLQGKAVVFDSTKNRYVTKPETRTTILDLSDSGFIVNILPPSVAINELEYLTNKEGKLVVADKKGFSLDINEFGIIR